MKKYDYVLVGAGLYSGVIAYLAGQAGKNCLVLERRDHTGGNIYCEEIEGIHVHKYGAHIFHTSNKEVWQFCQFAGRIQPLYKLADCQLQRRNL